MRNRYVVTYDISDAKRLRKTFNTLRAHGDHVQLSVFECLLSDVELVKLRSELEVVINQREDQVIFLDLGPAEGESPARFSCLGRPYRPMTLGPVVI
jgi:CRISPR-associated protein Cas2